MSDAPKLVTKAEYDALSPKAQGFLQYIQGPWPGSELKDLRNPYALATPQYRAWESGQAQGVIVAQDSEE